jgi:1-acyl-sn-glycerol-3-phosphate acyltransferase
MKKETFSKIARIILSTLSILAVAYTIGVAVGLTVALWILERKLRIEQQENIPKRGTAFLMVANHPSANNCMLECFILPGLLFWRYLFHPFKCSPWSAPDKKNFWWLKFMDSRIVWICRGKKGDASLLKIARILSSGGTLIYHAEGGRTENGSMFQESKADPTKRIRMLNSRLGWIVINTGIPVLPVWVEDEKEKDKRPRTGKMFKWPRGGRITVKIGELMKFTGEDSEILVTAAIAQRLIQLAEQKG